MPKVNAGPRLRLNRAGVWEITWTEKGRSHRASTRTKDRRQALQVLSGFLSGGASEDTGSPFRTIWSQYVAEHLEPKSRSASTIQAITKLLVSRFGDRDIRDIQPSDIVAYQKDRMSGKLTSCHGMKVRLSTVRLELTFLKAAINHAIKHRRVSSAEAPFVELPPPPAPRDKWLTEEQEADLLAKVATLTERDGKVNRVHLFCAIALSTASRKHAIETLRWRQVDLKKRIIDFRNPETQNNIKRRVPVPISDRLLPLLERARRENPFGEFVIDGGGEIGGAFDYWMEKFGYPWVTPHVLRHTWGTLAARAGVDLFSIAGVMGDSIVTVQKHYLHHCPEHLRQAVERVARDVGRNAPNARQTHQTIPDDDDVALAPWL